MSLEQGDRGVRLTLQHVLDEGGTLDDIPVNAELLIIGGDEEDHAERVCGY